MEIVEFERGDINVTKELAKSEKISRLREDILIELKRSNAREGSK